jgi:hypothetical protein
MWVTTSDGATANVEGATAPGALAAGAGAGVDA